MRSTYHIKIDKKDHEDLKSVFGRLGMAAEPAVTTNDEHGGHYDYLVELSKYELLFLRLACKTGEIIRVHREHQQEMSSDILQSMA
jgi:hypothetical protein